MNRLTPEERRRVRQAQHQADERMLTEEAPVRAVDGGTGQRWWRLVQAVAIAALIGVGFLVTRTLEFHTPTSLVEALLPRL